MLHRKSLLLLLTHSHTAYAPACVMPSDCPICFESLETDDEDKDDLEPMSLFAYDCGTEEGGEEQCEEGARTGAAAEGQEGDTKRGRRQVTSLTCGHRFCARCIVKWRTQHRNGAQKKCPLCRNRLPKGLTPTGYMSPAPHQQIAELDMEQQIMDMGARAQAGHSNPIVQASRRAREAVQRRLSAQQQH